MYVNLFVCGCLAYTILKLRGNQMTIAELSTKLDELNAKVDQVVSKVGDLKAEIANGPDVQELGDKVAQIESKIDGVIA